MTKKKTKKNNEVFIHIGLGRSGSDFLQKKIFPNLKGIKYVDRYNSKKFNGKSKIICRKNDFSRSLKTESDKNS